MSLTRRAFLQRSGAAGVGFGLGEVGSLLTRYQQALAQPTRRMALLVGINQYPEAVSDRDLAERSRSPVRGSVLAGCLTDIELQRQLLTSRFGFTASDIVTLTDQQATRTAIVDALKTLASEAQSNDAVVVHFSGLGSRVRLDAAGTQICNTIVPIDGTLPTEESSECGDLFAETFELLLGAIRSDRLTAVLDLSYSSLGITTQGNLRIRARPTAPLSQISGVERALQDELRQSQTRSRPTIISAAAIDQAAMEYQWNGFSAGLLTMALTQQLWQTTAPTQIIVPFQHAAAIVERITDQPPQLSVAQLSTNQTSAYETAAEAADGAILGSDADGKSFQVWLGGLPASVVEYYGVGSRLFIDEQPVDEQPVDERQAIIRNREGLVATARWVDAEALPPAVGQRVQEAVRLLPTDIGLTIALDPSLERIERVDATSAFAALSPVSAVVASEQSADYLFGKLQAPTLTASLEMAVPSEPSLQKGYGLFQLGRTALPNTLIEGEAVKTAVTRLAPQLQTLLALKLLRLSENCASSRLGVQANLLIAGESVMQQRTQRGSPASAAVADRAILPVGSRIDYQIQNQSDRPVYAILIGFDSSGNAIAGLPILTGETAQGGIPPGVTLTLPQSGFSNEWHASVGRVESHLVFSRAPFEKAAALLAIAETTGEPEMRLTPLAKPLELVQSVLQDLHQANPTETAGTVALDVRAWATLSFTYQLVASG